MRRALLNLLRCPCCAAEPLELAVRQENAQEVRAGRLSCGRCGQVYPLNDGVAELLPELDAATAHERTARDAQPRRWEIERQRPFIDDRPDAPWHWPGFAANVRQGLEQLELSGALVLDVGPGTCWTTRMLCERGAQAVALDVSTGMLRDGEAQFATGVYFDRLAATMEQLPCRGGVFDAVFASACVHHAENLPRAFAELARVLRPGGRLVLVNEPVLGVLRRGQHFGDEDTELGMNEHIYAVWDYLYAARRSGFAARVLFPAALAGQLVGRLPLVPSRAFRLTARLWAGLPDGLRRLSLWPGHLLIGLALVAVFRKRLATGAAETGGSCANRDAVFA